MVVIDCDESKLASLAQARSESARSESARSASVCRVRTLQNLLDPARIVLGSRPAWLNWKRIQNDVEGHR